MAEPRPERTPEPGPPEIDDPTMQQSPVTGDRPSAHVRLFGTHMFFRLWLAQIVSAMGDWLGFLAIIILATRVGAGSEAASVGFVMIARILPAFFLAPVAGVLVDRLDRKKVMVACDLGRAAVVMMLPFVDTVLGLVFASVILEVGTLLWSPAKEASVPNLVPPEYLTTANSLSLAAAYGTFPVASALFALLAKVADWLSGFHALDFFRVSESASLAFYFDVATFIASALMISSLALPERPRRDREVGARRIDWAQTYHELKEGWQFIFLNPVVRAVNVGLATGLIGGGMLVPLGVVFSQDVLGAGAAGYGLFITALGVGVAIGVLAISVLQRRLPKADVFTGSLFLAAVALFVAACMSSLTPAAVLVTVIGVCAGSVYVLGFTLLHENVGDELRGRIFSALYSLVRLCLLVAFAVGPFLSELLGRLSRRHLDSHIHVLGFNIFVPGVRLTLWLASLIILGAGVLALLSLRAGRLKAAAAEPTA